VLLHCNIEALERGEVDIEQLDRLDELSAGMPAAVLTIDGERIALDYPGPAARAGISARQNRLTGLRWPRPESV
jgi:hypothetical protein